ncbi:aspartate beta-hydroxylase domain-containing protein 2-like [Amphiura filiformis]|uniref:aspartate beta-hydroxylase domain-containing protein 2-like n=1 Tax=Amphiura filiformis TaxID=82378 RepID=UPI003B221E8A
MLYSNTFSFEWPLLEVVTSIPVLIITGFTVLFFIYRLGGPRASTSQQILYSNPSKLNTGTEEFSKCNSPGCVRCTNYKSIKENLAKKLDDYLQTIIVDNVDEENIFERLKCSVEKGEKAGEKHDEHEVQNLQDSQSILHNPTVFQLCGLSSKPWYERNEVCEQDVKLLENTFSTIWEEFTEVYEDFLQGDTTGWLSNLVPTGQWSVFHLYNQGNKVISNCIRCPNTARTLEKLGTFMCNIAFGNATFTVLQAGTHITEHYGPCNLRIRCHLGLQIPPCCSLTVAHQTKHWIEEGCLLFDDSYLHKAKHDGLEEDGPRIVFMVDLWHPEITEEEKSALKYLFTI